MLDLRPAVPALIVAVTGLVVLLAQAFTPQGPGASPSLPLSLAGLAGRPGCVSCSARAAAAAARPGRQRCVADDFALFFHGADPGRRRSLAVLLVARLPARDRHRPRRVLRAHAVLDRGHAGPRLLPRARLAVRGPRDHVGRALRAGRAATATAPESQEAALKYFITGAFSSALLPLRRGAALRRHRQHLARRASRSAIGAAGPRAAAARAAGRRPAAGGLRLQGGERALPHVGARRLRGRAHDGHRLHGRGREGGRLRRAPARLRAGPARAGRPAGSRRWRCSPSSRW